MPYVKRILSVLAAVSIPLIDEWIRTKTSLDIVIRYQFLSPWVWLAALVLFALFAVASSASSTVVRVVLFWTPTLVISTFVFSLVVTTCKMELWISFGNSLLTTLLQHFLAAVGLGLMLLLLACLKRDAGGSLNPLKRRFLVGSFFFALGMPYMALVEDSKWPQTVLLLAILCWFLLELVAWSAHKLTLSRLSQG
jgi:hypothetical protein